MQKSNLLNLFWEKCQLMESQHERPHFQSPVTSSEKRFCTLRQQRKNGIIRSMNLPYFCNYSFFFLKFYGRLLIAELQYSIFYQSKQVRVLRMWLLKVEELLNRMKGPIKVWQRRMWIWVCETNICMVSVGDWSSIEIRNQWLLSFLVDRK